MSADYDGPDPVRMRELHERAMEKSRQVPIPPGAEDLRDDTRRDIEATQYHGVRIDWYRSDDTGAIYRRAKGRRGLVFQVWNQREGRWKHSNTLADHLFLGENIEIDRASEDEAAESVGRKNLFQQLAGL